MTIYQDWDTATAFVSALVNFTFAISVLYYASRMAKRAEKSFKQEQDYAQKANGHSQKDLKATSPHVVRI